MTGRSVVGTARRVACPTCGVPRFEYCVDVDSNLMLRAHAARTAAAKAAPDYTPGQLEMLRRLHADPTRHIEPGMRLWFLRKGLIVALDPPMASHEHRRTRPPKRRHPLTDAGRAAIGVASAERAL